MTPGHVIHVLGPNEIYLGPAIWLQIPGENSVLATVLSATNLNGIFFPIYDTNAYHQTPWL